MTQTIQLEIVTPEKLLLSAAVTMVVVPGEAGDFGVMPGHVPLIASLRAGVIDVYHGDKITERFFVRGGFAEVTGNRVTLLAEAAIDLRTAGKDALIRQRDDLLAQRQRRQSKGADEAEITRMDKQIADTDLLISVTG